ncbi:C-type lectin lectoxin-Phi1 isoform X2 [Procambarus clarkii]|uniref:C-type lectin lectoxin-Phi1 isoform X2 n=1 Tax=Procambarus clarkii TaxID=6728 RepID=UPI001E670AE6|nr:C-type lectin lectoxin-Phi1-like isoform X2 [Procambarus clarkii]
MVSLLYIVLVLAHGIVSNGQNDFELLEVVSSGQIGPQEATSSGQGEAASDRALLKDLVNVLKKFNITNDRRCPFPFTQVLDSCYYLSEVSLTWKDARRYCQGMDGDLATPKHLYALKSFIFKARDYYSTPGVFLGGVKNGQHSWHWLDGRPIEDGYWYHNEPNNYYGREQCVEMRLQWHPTLNDEDCMKSQEFVCQFHLPE